MRENLIIKKWKEGNVVINAWLSIPCAWTAEIMAHVGFDSLTIDMQHGFPDFSMTLNMLQAISTTETVPLVRVPWNDPGILMRVLDAGAYGVICPMINNRSEAEAFVGACRYAPSGFRSIGPLRANLYSGKDYFSRSNDSVLTFAMIETAEALNNLEEITATPGLDGLYLGPSDLSVSLGTPEIANYKNPLLQQAAQKIVEVAKKYQKLPAAHANNPENAGLLVDWGFRLVTPMNDTFLLGAAADANLSETRKKLDHALFYMSGTI